MPYYEVTDYRPDFVFKKRHINTMYPYLFRKAADVTYLRTRHTTADDDFIDLDWIKNDNGRLVILCHGLEGDSSSQYIQYHSKLLSEHNYDICAINYRSCSGEMNRTQKMYHSGFTEDLHHVISTYESNYDAIHLVGFSLGGNIVLKYLSDGIYPLSSKLHNAVAQSVPCDLSNSCIEIAKWYNRQYEIRFLLSLRKKVHIKNQQFPGVLDVKKLSKVNSIHTFDEYFTAPMHGFRDAQDYYDQCNSLQSLHNIRIPTLLINAQDDPFLSASSYPYEIAKRHKFFHFKAPKHGGHLGFTTQGRSYYWNEVKTLEFLQRS